MNNVQPFYGLRNLQFLDLSRNQIEILHPNLFEGNPNLIVGETLTKSLNLSNNQLKKDIYLRCLFKLTKLKNLDLSQNCIYSLSYLVLEKHIKNSLGTLEHLCFKQVGQTFHDMFPTEKNKEKFLEHLATLKCWDFKKSPLESGLFAREKENVQPESGQLNGQLGQLGQVGNKQVGSGVAKQLKRPGMGESGLCGQGRKESMCSIVVEREPLSKLATQTELAKTPRHRKTASIPFNLIEIRPSEPTLAAQSPIKSSRPMHGNDTSTLNHRPDPVTPRGGNKPGRILMHNPMVMGEQAVYRSNAKMNVVGGSCSARKMTEGSIIKFRGQQTTACSNNPFPSTTERDKMFCSPINNVPRNTHERSVSVSGFCT